MSIFKNKHNNDRSAEKIEEKISSAKDKKRQNQLVFRRQMEAVNAELMREEEELRTLVYKLKGNINNYKNNGIDPSNEEAKLKTAFYNYKLIRAQRFRLNEVTTNRELRVAMNDINRTLGFISGLNDVVMKPNLSTAVNGLILKAKLYAAKRINQIAGAVPLAVETKIRDTMKEKPIDNLVGQDVVGRIMAGESMDKIDVAVSVSDTMGAVKENSRKNIDGKGKDAGFIDEDSDEPLKEPVSDLFSDDYSDYT